MNYNCKKLTNDIVFDVDKVVDDDGDYQEVEEIAKDIYKDDKKRIHILVQTVKEYVEKATQGSKWNLDLLLNHHLAVIFHVHKHYFCDSGEEQHGLW